MTDPAAVAETAWWAYDGWQRWARAAGKLAVVAVLTYLLVTFALFVLQRRLVFPAGTSAARLRAADFAGGRDLRDIRVETADGLRLHGWLAVAPGGPVGRGDRRLILLLHGNGGDRRQPAGGKPTRFTALGWDVLLTDYRGYGENPGSPYRSRPARRRRGVVGRPNGDRRRVPAGVEPSSPARASAAGSRCG